MDLLKDILGGITKFFVNERVNDYRSSYLRNQDVQVQVTLEMDRALMTFSIAALAALAALNDRVFSDYGWLSFTTLTVFVGVVILVIIGYHISRHMLIDANKIISANFKRSLTAPLGAGLEKVKFAKASKIINFLSLTFFVTGMLLLIILLAAYIARAGQ